MIFYVRSVLVDGDHKDAFVEAVKFARTLPVGYDHVEAVHVSGSIYDDGEQMLLIFGADATKTQQVSNLMVQIVSDNPQDDDEDEDNFDAFDNYEEDLINKLREKIKEMDDRNEIV